LPHVCLSIFKSVGEGDIFYLVLSKKMKKKKKSKRKHAANKGASTNMWKKGNKDKHVAKREQRQTWL
jgi:hypothetical protein